MEKQIKHAVIHIQLFKQWSYDPTNKILQIHIEISLRPNKYITRVIYIYGKISENFQLTGGKRFDAPIMETQF